MGWLTFPLFFRFFYRASAVQTTVMEKSTVEDFGYTFNERGELCRMDPLTKQPTDERFEFMVHPDAPHLNQQNYEALGEVITEHVYKLLETEGNLKKVHIGDKEIKSFVFTSKDYLDNQDKLLILIHGSGVVRAGQWARRLIINDNLDSGTQLPFIKQAQQEGYAVVVANTNDNHRFEEGKKYLIHGSENPVNHLLTVWHEIINASPARHVAIVAHSYGGVCALELAKREPSFTERVFALAMTDSVHCVAAQNISKPLLTFLKKVGRNWIASGEPLDTPLKTQKDDIPRVSAGHTQHEMTSYISMASIFQFFRDKLKEKEGSTTPNSDL